MRFGAAIVGIPAITPLGWAIVVYTALFPSIISQIFYVRGVELIGANRASLFINLVPLFGALGSVVLLGERFEAFHAAAVALVVTGIVLARVGGPSPADHDPGAVIPAWESNLAGCNVFSSANEFMGQRKDQRCKPLILSP